MSGNLPSLFLFDLIFLLSVLAWGGKSLAKRMAGVQVIVGTWRHSRFAFSSSSDSPAAISPRLLYTSACVKTRREWAGSWINSKELFVLYHHLSPTTHVTRVVVSSQSQISYSLFSVQITPTVTVGKNKQKLLIGFFVYLFIRQPSNQLKFVVLLVLYLSPPHPGENQKRQTVWENGLVFSLVWILWWQLHLCVNSRLRSKFIR